jgi:hypothetical protein
MTGGGISAQKEVAIYAFMGMVGNILLVVTYFADKDFAQTMPSAKHILMVECIMECIALCGFLWQPASESDWDCGLQFSLIQLYLACALLSSILAIEMAVLAQTLYGQKASLVSRYLKKKDQIPYNRYYIYGTLFSVHYITTILYVLMDNQYGLTAFNDKWCWLKTDKQRLYLGYLSTIWVSMLISIPSIAFTMRTIYKKINSELDPALDDHSQMANITRSAVASIALHDPKAKNRLARKVLQSFARILADVSVFIILWLPGSIRRGSNGDIDSPFLLQCQYVDVSYGFWKFVIWVGLDSKVRKFWYDWFWDTFIPLLQCEAYMRSSEYSIDNEIPGMNHDTYSSNSTVSRLSTKTKDRNTNSTTLHSHPINPLHDITQTKLDIIKTMKNGDSDDDSV